MPQTAGRAGPAIGLAAHLGHEEIATEGVRLAVAALDDLDTVALLTTAL